MAVSLQSKLEFKVITKVRQSYECIGSRIVLKSIEVDGMFYEPRTNRFFVASRSSDYLQEVVIDKDGNCCQSKSLLRTLLCKRDCAGVKGPINTGMSCELINQIRDGIFGRLFNYRTHAFSYEPIKQILFHLETNWEATNGLEDKIVGQSLHIYSLNEGQLEYWGEVRNERLALETKPTEKSFAAALKEVSTSKIAGISSSQSEEWDLSIMYTNGFRLLIQILITNDTYKTALPKLYNYIPPIQHEVLKRTSKSSNQGIYQQFALKRRTTAYLGFEKTHTEVQKQIGADGSLVITVFNRTSVVPSAEQFNLDTKEIKPLEKFLTHSISSIIEVLFCYKVSFLC
jgi:hypothetical protein